MFLIADIGIYYSPLNIKNGKLQLNSKYMNLIQLNPLKFKLLQIIPFLSWVFDCKTLTSSSSITIIQKAMHSPRFLTAISKQNSKLFFSFFNSSGYCYSNTRLSPSQHRLISSTTPVASWMDTIKGVFTGKKGESNVSKESVEAFTLLYFADALKNARRVGSFKEFIVGRSSEATFADAFEKMEGIIRYLHGFDPTGEKIQTSQKQEAAKHCNCTVAEVEKALAQFTWAREAQKKLLKLKEEGKPVPNNMGEIQKMMGSTPLDLARSNLAKSGQLSRNALCPCGSKKRYKWCCGKDSKV